MSTSTESASVHFNRGAHARQTSDLAEGAYDHYFTVIDLNALVDELRARGAESLDGPEGRVYGQREVVVRDCNDFILAFGEALPNPA